MEYSTKLKKMLKKCYPDYSKIHQIAEEGNPWLGRYLDDSTNGMIHAKSILGTTSFIEVRAMAQRELDKIECYKLWNEEYREYVNSQEGRPEDSKNPTGDERIQALAKRYGRL